MQRSFVTGCGKAACTFFLLSVIATFAFPVPAPGGTGAPDWGRSVIEYSERRGAIVHIGLLRPAGGPGGPTGSDDELRNLVRKTFEKLRPRWTAPSPAKAGSPPRGAHSSTVGAPAGPGSGKKPSSSVPGKGKAHGSGKTGHARAGKIAKKTGGRSGTSGTGQKGVRHGAQATKKPKVAGARSGAGGKAGGKSAGKPGPKSGHKASGRSGARPSGKGGKPAPVDYTLVPNDENKIKCPDPNCGFMNDVMNTICVFCGARLRTSPEIEARREELLAKAQDEEMKKLAAASRSSSPGGAASPDGQASTATEPGGPAAVSGDSAQAPAGADNRATVHGYALKGEDIEHGTGMSAGGSIATGTGRPTARNSPPYRDFGLEIGQLATAYRRLATQKIARAGAKALHDLSLALNDPDPAVVKEVRRLLATLLKGARNRAASFVQALRKPDTRPAARLAVEGAGYDAAEALMAELQADRPDSADEVVALLGKLGAKAVPLIEQKLTPEYVTLYPRLSAVLVAVGKPAVSTLTRLLRDSNDEYLVEFASNTLVKIGKRASDQLIAALEEEKRPDRKKRIIEVIGSIGAEDAVDALSRYVRQGRCGLNLAARQALCRIGSEKALRIVGGLLACGSRTLTEKTLDMLCASGGPAAYVLGELAKDKNSRLRTWAVTGLGKLAAGHPEMKPVVEAALEDRSRSVRRAARQAIQAFH